MTRILRQPLVRFLLAGALVLAFAPDTGAAPSGPPVRVPRRIDDPAQAERWLDEEVLVRRARERGIDELDLVVRRRLAQQMRFLLDDMASVDEPGDADLERWLATHPDRYRQPATSDVRHVFFSRAARGESLVADAEAALRELRAGASPGSVGDAFFRGSEMRAATPAVLTRAFGAEFAAATEALEVGRWSGPIASSYGLHAVLVEARQRERPAELRTVRDAVRRDWLAQQRGRAERAMLDRLRAEYGVPPAAVAPAGAEDPHGEGARE